MHKNALQETTKYKYTQTINDKQMKPQKQKPTNIRTAMTLFGIVTFTKYILKY